MRMLSELRATPFWDRIVLIACLLLTSVVKIVDAQSTTIHKINPAQMRRLHDIEERIKSMLDIEVISNKSAPGSKIAVPAHAREIPVSMPDIVTLSEKADNVADTNVLQFKVHTGVKYHGALEANSADIFILVKKKRGSRIRTRKGKRISIKIFQYDINETSSSPKLVTALRTRIKNTRWQKISLPISLAQQVLESENGILRLKVECRQCGKKIRPVLVFKGRGRRKRRPKSSLVRLNSERPILVITPRVKSSFG